MREWLKSLGAKDRRTIGRGIATLEYGWPLGMPLCRPLGRGLYEIRSNIGAGRIARVIFFVSGQHMVLLHGFIKKSRKAPMPDINLAARRMTEYKRHE